MCAYLWNRVYVFKGTRNVYGWSFSPFTSVLSLEKARRELFPCVCAAADERSLEAREAKTLRLTSHRTAFPWAPHEKQQKWTRKTRSYKVILFIFLFSATIARRLTRKAQLEHVEHNKLQLWRRWNFNYRKVSRLRLSANSVSVVLSSQEAETSLASFPVPRSFSSSRLCLPRAGLQSRRLITSCNRVIEFGWCRLPAAAFLLIKQLV